MKHLLLALALCCAASLSAQATPPTKHTVAVAVQAQDEKTAEIQFENVNHNFGTFSEQEPVVKCTFKFTNTGTAPLIIHQAIASCGCTVPTFTKTPVRPGESGTIEVTYNGKGKATGQFKKVITVRSNAKENGVVRLYIEGNMTSDGN